MAPRGRPRAHDWPDRGRIHREAAMTHPAIQPGRVAVITGAASGIGLAAAKRFSGLGMHVWMADYDKDALSQAGAEVRALFPNITATTQQIDVASSDDVRKLQAAVADHYPDVAILMNNAGVGGGGNAIENPDRWRKVLETNLFGVINGCQVFGQAMTDAGIPAAIINTGSKQGITAPPGDTAYNVSKAAIKTLTEG